MPKLQVRSVPGEPKNHQLSQAHTILKYTHETGKSLLEVFDEKCAKRGQGAPTTEEQDLLRSMLVMTGSGLDATLKQIARDALREIQAKSTKAQEEFSKFVVREFERREGGISIKNIAEYLVAESPRQRLLSQWVEELTSKSLQSLKQIESMSACLGIEKPLEFIRKKEAELNRAFDVRNQIAHEMDIDFTHKVRNRRSRKREDMVEQVNLLLDLCGHLLKEIDGLLSK